MIQSFIINNPLVPIFFSLEDIRYQSFCRKYIFNIFYIKYGYLNILWLIHFDIMKLLHLHEIIISLFICNFIFYNEPK